MMKKRLHKSNEDKIFAGVLGGIGEYFDIDPTILRLLYILIAVMTALFPAIIGYVIAALVVPKRPETHHVHHTEHSPEPESETEK